MEPGHPEVRGLEKEHGLRMAISPWHLRLHAL